MVQLPQENSIFARTVRRAAGEDRLRDRKSVV